MRVWLSLVVLMFATVAVAAALTPLTIESGAARHTLMVELVDTPETRARGLMHRSSMPADHGMLFDFQTQRPVSFWMKNTLIPLDMIFADQNGVIVHIHRNAIPHDETGIRSVVPVRVVLEINGGVSDALNIRVGDRLRHHIFE